MNKTIATTLLILASGLTLSTTALAEPFNRSGSHVNAISNAHSSTNTPSVQSVRQTDMLATVGGFNDRTEYEVTTVNSSPVVESSLSRMLSIITRGFNDRGKCRQAEIARRVFQHGRLGGDSIIHRVSLGMR
ncbi:MAG: hypothetical protein U1F70_06635 [Candidatus Competibacteraceae bacterium]